MGLSVIFVQIMPIEPKLADQSKKRGNRFWKQDKVSNFVIFNFLKTVRSPTE